MIRRLRFLWILTIGTLVFGVAAVPLPAATVAHIIPGMRSVLIINQNSPSYPVVASNRGKQIEMLLRHFTANTVRISEAEYVPGKLTEYDDIVVIANDAITPLPSALLDDVAHARRPVLWIGYGLERLPVDMSATFGFSPGYWTSDNPPIAIEYQGKTYAAKPGDYSDTRVASPSAHVYATYHRAHESIPFIVQGNGLWYVNGLPSLGSAYPSPAQDAPTLIFADVLHDFFGTTMPTSHNAVIRLEDVSARIDPARLIAVVDYLSSQHVPFALGVIPAQEAADGSIAALSDHPEFVKALRYAQAHGGTIVLHGYNHALASDSIVEDYEFWDINRNAPPDSENWDMYAAKIEAGIRTLRDYGIEPQLWETPHYAASPLAYRVIASYFSYAIENRNPSSWLPYPAGPDEYGQTLIPETLGYINPAGGLTVADQLQRADLLKIVRDDWAVGYYHPAFIPLSELESLVSGLRDQGYTFFDLRSLPLQVHYGYQAGLRGRLLRFISQAESWIPWWTTLRGIPWRWGLATLIVAAFLIRLRAQWHPRGTHARSLVEHEGRSWRTVASRLPRVVRRGALPFLAVAVLLGAGWTFVSGNRGVTSGDAAGPPAAGANLAPSTVTGYPPNQGTAASANGANALSDGWELSVYYTAVESYHAGQPQDVYGCLSFDCANGNDLLGTYPADFVAAVKEEGTGRITSGVHTGQYLNWAIDTGYWLDSAARDARGLPLVPYISAAADPSVPFLATFRVIDCGTDYYTHAPIKPASCGQLQAPNWEVRDRFTVGTVGKHVDLYVGEEDRPEFIATSPRVTDVTGATIALQTQPVADLMTHL